MKRIVQISIYMLIAGSFFIFSCRKNEDPLEENTIILADTSLYTGDLVVQANHWDGSNNIPADWGFRVSLYFSRQDADDNLPYLTVYTNNRGEAYFGYLVMGNYYVKGTGSENGVVYESDLTPTQILPRRTNFTVINVKQP